MTDLQRARTLIRRQVLEALERFDLLVWPTAHQAVPAIARNAALITSRGQVAGRFFIRRSYVSPVSLAGVPAIALPRLRRLE